MGRVGNERGEAGRVSRLVRNDKTISSEGSGKKAGRVRGGAFEYRNPSARKKRGPQDDKVVSSVAKNAGVDGETKLGRRKFPPKRVGELGELAFLQKAIRMGFLVSKPWGDSDRYDFIVDWEGQLYRVQVRSTECMQGPRGYAVHASVYVGKKIVGLTKKEIDVLVAYIFPKDAWYVVPVEKFVPRKNLWFYPDGSKKGAKFEKFREAWGWMRGEGARKKRK